jgi:hypothetical protein
MPYEEIDELLRCKQCGRRYFKPRNLPCGESICLYCIDDLIEKQPTQVKDKINCCFCREEHSVPENGFPSSKELERLIAKRPRLAAACKTETLEEFKTQLNDVKREIDFLNANLDCSIEKVKNHYSHLKCQTQLKADSLVIEINKLNDGMQQEIQEREKNTIEALEKMISEGNLFCEKNSKYLSNCRLDEDEVTQLIEKAKQALNECKILHSGMRVDVFSKSLTQFEENEKKHDFSLIGHLRKWSRVLVLDSVILSEKQRADLIKFCQFDSSSKWALIYRASRDGRMAHAFHSKCDNRAKTLTVIKSTYGDIFGGYTEQMWDTSKKFKKDPNAFIFSLVNRIAKGPLLFKKEMIKDLGIYGEANYGPIFLRHYSGTTLNSNESDILISFSDKKSISYLNIDKKLGCTLASSINFSFIELEIFQMIPNQTVNHNM